MAVLGVVFPDKLGVFCCSHHLRYDILKYFSSFASLPHLPHLLFNCWLSDSPSLTPFFSCSKYHYRPSLVSCHPGHPAALVKSGSYTQPAVVAFQNGVLGTVNPLCRSNTRYPGASSVRRLHISPKGYRSPWSSFHKQKKNGGGRKSARARCKTY